MTKTADYNAIMADRLMFNQTVYTTLPEALRILDERRKDKDLVNKVEKFLNNSIPEILKSKKCGVLGRHIATPNHESIRFISLCKEYDLHPVFFEYHDDKFTSNNDFKHSLGQLHVRKSGSKSGESVEKITIVDFNENNGKKLREVRTLWDESLVDFHKKLFAAHKYNPEDFHLYNASEWFRQNGGNKAASFYKSFLALFLCHGILFENYLTSKDEEGSFTKDIVLPTIDKIADLFGLKPLIVPLGPIESEQESFWLYHLPKVKELIPNNKK